MPLTLVLPVSYGLPPRNVPANHPATTSEELLLDRHRKHPMANVVQTVSRQHDDAISHGGMAGSAARSGNCRSLVGATCGGTNTSIWVWSADTAPRTIHSSRDRRRHSPTQNSASVRPPAPRAPPAPPSSSPPKRPRALNLSCGHKAPSCPTPTVRSRARIGPCPRSQATRA